MKSVLASVLSVFMLFTVVINTAKTQSLPAYKNPNLPIQTRVDDLVGRMTLEEKVSQMMNAAPAIDRLGIPQYDWWNEALHGVARAGLRIVTSKAKVWRWQSFVPKNRIRARFHKISATARVLAKLA